MRTVAVVIQGSLAVDVTAWAETEAGWHVSTVDGRPSPDLVLADAVIPGRPTVVVVDGEATAEQVREGLRGGALDVVSWPEQRGQLLRLADLAGERVADHRGPAGPRILRVAGAGGGAGTSTVTLALGGLLAWAGQRVIVVGGDDLLGLAGFDRWSGPGVDEVMELDPAGAAEEVAVLSRPVAGVPGLRALGRSPVGPGVGPQQQVPIPGQHSARWPAQFVVADMRTAASAADLVVARPDRSLTTAGGAPVVVVGRGPADRAEIRRLLGADPLAWLPSSARIARAGLAGRVPSALPGSWLAQLRPVLAHLLASSEQVQR